MNRIPDPDSREWRDRMEAALSGERLDLAAMSELMAGCPLDGIPKPIDPMADREGR